nr:lectin [Actinospica sp.]
MLSTLAGSAVAMVGGAELVSGLTSSASAASPAGDVVGKITVGYQGWFACKGDGAPINGWWHWSQNMASAPSTSNTNIKAWPDMADYTATYKTAFANFNNGQPATLFSSYDQQTVNTHFSWMQQNGCDTAALQRFNPTGGEGPTRDAMAAKVKSAAEAYGRKFYIMYDVSGWTTMQADIKADWTNKMSAYTSSSAYARQSGKPVVCIWGFGFNDSNHTWDAATCLDVVNWFKNQGCYVIGGVPTHWRTSSDDSRAGFLDVYHAFNMLSPWMVGRIGSVADTNNFYTNVNTPDMADCKANGIDYQPCVLPGDLSANQRAHGDFMWAQFYNMVRVGAQGIYISMFDEYGEGNQIGKTSASQATVPAGSGLLALDEDGTACSTDYYLRLTNDGGKMLKGQIALTSTRPTPPIPSTTTPSPSPTATAGCGMLTADQNFVVNKPLLSCDGRFKLVLGGDGNLVLYQGGTVLWSAKTSGKGATQAYMQGDGNFVLYTAAGSPVWSSGTAGNNGATLSVQDDGNVVIASSAGKSLWTTGTAGH